MRTRPLAAGLHALVFSAEAVGLCATCALGGAGQRHGRSRHLVPCLVPVRCMAGSWSLVVRRLSPWKSFRAVAANG